MPNLATKLNPPEGEAKSSRRMSCDSTGSSSGSNFRELDTEFLTTQAKIWIENILEERYDEEETVADLLADGEILYKISKLVDELMQKKFGAKIYSPVSEATHFGKQSGKYLPYSHIDSFLKICKKLGLPGVDLFSPPDAVEKRDVRRVCLCIRALSRKARSKDLDVPDFDVVTDFLFMGTGMVDAMQKYLEQNMHSTSSKTQSNSGTESKKGSGKNNEPFFTGPFEVAPEDPDEAESKLKTSVLENLDSILGEITGATIANHSMSPRSPHFATLGSSSENSTVGGSQISDSLSEVNTPLTPENDDGQKDNEGSRIKDLTDALHVYLEKSGSLTVRNPLNEIKDPLTPVSNQGNFFNEYPTIIVKDRKNRVNGELGKMVQSYSDESIQEDEVDTSRLLSSLFSFDSLEGHSDGVDHVNDIKADGVDVHMTTGSLPTTNSAMKMSIASIPGLSINDSVDSQNGSGHEEGGHSTSVSVFCGNEQGINDMEIECKNVKKTQKVDFGTANTPKFDSLDAGPENVLKGCSKDFGSPSASEAVSFDTNPAFVSDINNVKYYYVNEPKRECLDDGRKGKIIIVDIDRVTMPREDIFDVVNENAPKTDGMDVDRMKIEPLHTINVPPSVLLTNNNAQSHYPSDSVNGGYAHSSSVQVSDGFAQGITNDTEIDTKNVPKAWRVDVGPTDAPKLGSLDIGHENGWKGDGVDSYTSVPQAGGIDTDTTNLSNVYNVNGCCVHEPQTKWLDIEFVNEAKPDNGNTVQTDIVDRGSANVPKTESIDFECMPTDPLLLTTSPSIQVLVSTNADEEHGHSASTSVTNGTGQGEINNADCDYANVLQKEEVEGGPTNAQQLDSLDDSPENSQNADSLFYDCRFAPQTVSVDIDQCVNKERRDIDCGVMPKRDSLDMVNTNVSVPKVNSMDIKCTAEVEEECVAHSGKGLEADNVYDQPIKVLKSETVVANRKTGDINCADGTEEDSVVTAGNRFVGDNVDNNCTNVLKADIIDAERAVTMQTGDSKCAVATRENSFVHAAGNGLETDNIDHESTNLLKSKIVDIDSVVNNKTGDINLEDVSDENSVVNALKGLEANIVNDNCKTDLKSETVGVDSARHMRTVDINCAIVTEEDSVNAVNNLEVDIDNDCKKTVKVFSAAYMETKINCSVMTEEEHVNVGYGLEANNIDSINVPKPDIVDVDSPANMKTEDSCSLVTEEKCAVNADKSKNVLKLETLDICSAVDMEMRDINRADVTEEDFTVNNDNGLDADNVDNDSKNVLKPDTVCVDSVVNTKTGYTSFPVVTEVESAVNAGKGLEEDINDNHSKNVLKSDAIVDSASNVKTSAVNHAVVFEEASIVNTRSGLEADNIDAGSINVMNSEIFDIDSAVITVTGDIGRSAVIEEDHAAYADNGLEASHVVDGTRNMLKLETLYFDSTVSTKTGDIICSVVSGVDSVVNSGNKMEAENNYNDTRNVLKLGADSSTNMKTGDINGEVVSDNNIVVDAGNVLEANNIYNGSINMLKLETVDVDNETTEENVFRASESRNQLQSPAGCEHDNDYKDRQNESETSSPKEDESTETKHIRKPNIKRLWISVFAGGIAVVGVAMVRIRWWNRKQEEYEIKEGDTLSDVSKRAGKSSWKELVLINPQIKNPDSIYPGQRLKLQ